MSIDNVPGSTSRGLRIRRAVRAVIVTPERDVLLVRFQFPTRQVWALPGGGLDPGEDHLAALHRELHEEVGLRDVGVGPAIWIREHLWPHADGRWDGQHDVIHLVEVPERFEPAPALSWEQLRAERLQEIRWWSHDEITTSAAADVVFAPRRMGDLLTELHRDGIPSTPLLTGV